MKIKSWLEELSEMKDKAMTTIILLELKTKKVKSTSRIIKMLFNNQELHLWKACVVNLAASNSSTR